MLDEEMLKAFVLLIERYKAITIEEIEKIQNEMFSEPLFLASAIAFKLTRYSSGMFCTLCTTATKLYNYSKLYNHSNKCYWNSKCNYCYNVISNSRCNTGENLKTYDNIRYAKTPEELLLAFRARAKHIQYLLERYATLQAWHNANKENNVL